MIQISIDDIYKNSKDQRDEAEKKLKVKRGFIKNMDYETFKNVIAIKSERIFLQRSEPRGFKFDEFNKSIIEQFYYYAIGSDKFKGSIWKGIHLWGDYGCGKTTLVLAFCEIINEISGKIIKTILAKELGNSIIRFGIEYFVSRPIFLDDIGREIKELKNYGNLLRPVPDLYYLRKEKGAWTFQTCQKPISDLEQVYGKFTTDRMRAAFNEIEFKGNSRR